MCTSFFFLTVRTYKTSQTKFNLFGSLQDQTKNLDKNLMNKIFAKIIAAKGEVGFDESDVDKKNKHLIT